MKSARPPAAVISRTVALAASSAMSPTTTLAPSWAKRLAVALPIPRAPPVMMATLSSNLGIQPPIERYLCTYYTMLGQVLSSHLDRRAAMTYNHDRYLGIREVVGHRKRLLHRTCGLHIETSEPGATMPTLRPIQRTRVSDAVSEQIIELIGQGELKPGDKLRTDAGLMH